MSAPILNTFEDVLMKHDEIKNYVKNYPDTDVVYTFKVKDIDKKVLNLPNCYIAGSNAVFLLRQELKTAQGELTLKSYHKFKDVSFYTYCINMLRNPHLEEKNRQMIVDFLENFKNQYYDFFHEPLYGDFKSDDIDFFILNSVNHHRVNIGSLDVVHLSYKTPEELILHFDLPCCRAARDLNDNFYVSIQCLSSLLDGQVYLPSCYNDQEKYNLIINDLGIKSRWDKLHFRIAKYENRGYHFEYYDTNQIPKSLAKSFTYNQVESTSNECIVELQNSTSLKMTESSNNAWLITNFLEDPKLNDSLINQLIPIGTIIHFPDQMVVSKHYKECNGQKLLVKDFKELCNAICFQLLEMYPDLNYFYLPNDSNPQFGFKKYIRVC